jgi:hypothetical protein
MLANERLTSSASFSAWASKWALENRTTAQQNDTNDHLQVAACVCPGGVKRKLDESMTLNPETPKTLASESTTAMVSFALPIMPVVFVSKPPSLSKKKPRLSNSTHKSKLHDESAQQHP